MTHGIGKKKWRWQPAFDRQLQDGRSHITCPKCNASLGDAWDGKGGREWSPVGAFAHQYQDGRQHLTCPRCSFLLGKAYWQHPTAWDWIKYIFSERASVMGWLAATFIIAVGLLLTTIVGISLTRSDRTFMGMIMQIPDGEFLVCFGIIWMFAFLVFWISHVTTDDGDDGWWWFYS